MAQVAVTEALADLVGPLFEFGCVDFDGRPAVPTGQVVVVGVDHAASVETLSAVGHDDVDLATGDESFQLGVDRRERDLTTVTHDERVQVLGTDEALDPTQHPDYLTALGGVAGRGHTPSLMIGGLQIGMIPSNLNGMVPKKTRVALLAGLALTLVAVLAIFVRGAFGGPALGRPVIVAGVSQWGVLARELASPDLRVISLLSDPNADPHEHEATVGDAANVSRATYVVLNGAGYDSWLQHLTALQGPQAHVISVAGLMGVSAGQNPHLFYDPAAAMTLVRRLTTTLDAHGHYPGVDLRSRRLLAQLDVVAHRVALIRSSCAKVPVAATEDVATYLLDAAGLRVVTPERLRLAIGNGVDPTIQDLAAAIAQLRAHPAFLIDNVQTATPLTNQLVAEATGQRVPVIRVTETMTGTSYVAWIEGVIGQMEQALRREGCLK